MSCLNEKSAYKRGVSGQDELINPRRACAARVTVLGLCVCVSVCLSVCLLPRFLPLRATRRPKSDTNEFSATLALFLKRRF